MNIAPIRQKEDKPIRTRAQRDADKLVTDLDNLLLSNADVLTFSKYVLAESKTSAESIEALGENLPEVQRRLNILKEAFEKL